MSDINADAAPSSTEPSAPVASVAEGKPIESGATIASMPSADTSIPSGSEISSAGDYVPPTVSEIVEAVKADTRAMVDSGNVAAAVEGGAPAIGVVAAVGGDLPNVESGAEAQAESNSLSASQSSESAPTSGTDSGTTDLPRESHLMLLKAKLSALEAKIGTGALVLKAEFADIMAHIEAVL